MHAPVPPNEEARVNSLRALKVLDTPPETDFDDIVRMASEISDAPISLVSLIDTERQWFKARLGLPAGINETPREVSFCAHAIMGRDLMVVPDASTDARFADNPYVIEAGGIRFYAGAPLLTSDGAALGTLCVVDHTPHRLTLDQMRALRALARQVSELLELRRLGLSGEAGVRPEPRSVDLTYLVEGRVRDMRPIADARNTAITFGVADSTSIRADPQRLAQALDYVLFTALKVAPVGGRVKLRVTGTPCPAIEISHAGGSITPAWQADLSGVRTAEEPVPRAVADLLRAHGATVASTSATVGSPDVRFEVRFPSF